AGAHEVRVVPPEVAAELDGVEKDVTARHLDRATRRADAVGEPRGVNLHGGDVHGRRESAAGRQVHRGAHEVLHAALVADVEQQLAILAEAGARSGLNLRG